MITANLIIPVLQATSKKQALRLIAEEVTEKLGGDATMLLTALLDRERIGTTGIGGGVAIPHVKVDSVREPFGVLARLSEPVDFDAIDEKPVDIIFMLLAPADSKTTQHLKTLAHISRFLKDHKTCASLRCLEEQDKIRAMIEDWTRAQAA
jgi:PTS system nitrogen regulatory IIA component